MQKCDRQVRISYGRDIAVIAAVASNGVIGSRGGVPWNIPEDLRRFRRLTTGHTVVMGWRTWESIGKPLPNRENIVVSRRCVALPVGVRWADSLRRACQMSRYQEPVFVIGGTALYAEALVVAAKLFLTEIRQAFEGDVVFPEFERESWVEIDRERNTCEQPSPFDFDFVEYVRRRQAHEDVG